MSIYSTSLFDGLKIAKMEMCRGKRGFNQLITDYSKKDIGCRLTKFT